MVLDRATSRGHNTPIMINISAATHSQSHTRRSEFLRGAKDTTPLVVAAIPFGIVFGAVAVTGDLSPWAAMGMSLFVFAGSSQFIAAGMAAQGAAASLIILTALIVNLRHMLYSASLSPYVKNLPHKWLLPLGFFLTDETYAIVIRRYPEQDESPNKHWYHLGSSLAMYSVWQVSSLTGIIAGTQLEGLAEWGLDFAMLVTFIGITVPLVRTRPMAVCALTAAITAVALHDLPNQTWLILAALAGIAAGLISESLLPGSSITHHEPQPHE